jgi:hypothetical protein
MTRADSITNLIRSSTAGRNAHPPKGAIAMSFRFPFRRDNRRPDGYWDVPDANEDNIKGTSVDPYDPVWPRWKQAPPHHGEGEFISDDPFFDIDEIMQRAEFYPPGRPLVDKTFREILRAVNELAICPAAISRDGACWFGMATMRVSFSGP